MWGAYARWRPRPIPIPRGDGGYTVVEQAAPKGHSSQAKSPALLGQHTSSLTRVARSSSDRYTQFWLAAAEADVERVYDSLVIMLAVMLMLGVRERASWLGPSTKPFTLTAATRNSAKDRGRPNEQQGLSS